MLTKLLQTLFFFILIFLSSESVAQGITFASFDQSSTLLPKQNMCGYDSIQPYEQLNTLTECTHCEPSENRLSLNYQQLQSTQKNSTMISNRRLKYSSLWVFVSLNYLYADLVGIMDINLLSQYQTGVVNGVEITPAFLTVAAAYMQIPLSNVFLPHVIKNENTLRWVQIISGSIATVVQGATLFVGEPAPYYVLFTAIEMAATAYITIDSIKWKTQKVQTQKPIGLY